MEAWAVGRLGEALDGTPGDFEVTVLGHLWASSLATSHKMTVAGACPDEDDYLFDVELEFPHTDLGWSAGRLREAMIGVPCHTVIAAPARRAPNDPKVLEHRVVAAEIHPGEHDYRFAIKLDLPSGRHDRPSSRPR